MKALLLIAALASMLAGCSMMPGRSSGSMPAESSSQTMGGMNMIGDRDRWMHDDNGRPWTGGDGAFYGAQNM
ncbi:MULTISPECIES: hypothetical protein [Comamonas]|uniref:hypothetical protein n=1 Tax=Comamonas TaxID=283 RepID=UPI0001DA64AC|nr:MULTISPECIES: hypothetical protein [Comamonas]BCX53501.1 hypothetical protein CTYAZ2_30820 [Comamonas testosteroni]EFI62754.1 hypothetical protein CTS44_05301 [Comamonas thiooxydans]KKI12982.1 hypothetical protein XA67_16495 [Comamonas thiooxydans]MDH1253271.1 hypothetical protein [Comamonas thiooxydans]TFF62816.1 hypothetical protein EIC84_01805 [Comamonas sp. A23]